MIFEVSAVALLLAFLTRKQKKTTGGGEGPGPYRPPGPTPQQPDPTGPNVPTPGGPKPTPGGPKPVSPSNPPSGSRVFGDPKGPLSSAIVTGDIVRGNWIMVAKDCSWVIEGPHLWHSAAGKIRNEEAPNLVASLALGFANEPNNLQGYIDYCDSTLGLDAAATAEKILGEAAPMCAAIGPQFWGKPLQRWYENLVGKIVTWRQVIPFKNLDKPPVTAGKSNCHDYYVDASLSWEALEAVRAEYHNRRAADFLYKSIEVLWPTCNPKNNDARMHGIRPDGVREWFRIGDAVTLFGNVTVSTFCNDDDWKAKFATIVHPEQGDAASPLDTFEDFFGAIWE